jgi:predicted translin family RNA/ssDNA-binding protein
MQNIQLEADLVKTQVEEENRQTKQITQSIKELEPEIRNYPKLVEVTRQVTDVLPSYI